VRKRWLQRYYADMWNGQHLSLSDGSCQRFQLKKLQYLPEACILYVGIDVLNSGDYE
jgi:hypothetical protein